MDQFFVCVVVSPACEGWSLCLTPETSLSGEHADPVFLLDIFGPPSHSVFILRIHEGGIVKRICSLMQGYLYRVFLTSPTTLRKKDPRCSVWVVLLWI